MNACDTMQNGHGFLRPFRVACIKKPADGLNGDCVIHYASPYRKYEMRVKLLNGYEHGKAIIYNREKPYIRLVYINGVANGVVERMSDKGKVEMTGHLVDGIENGLFDEFDDNSNVVWRGYYRNGKRYSEVIECERLKGYYEERNVYDGRLISVAQYDNDLHDKNGHCLEYENDKWVGEWIYENGVKKSIVQEYRNGKNILYDENREEIEMIENHLPNHIELDLMAYWNEDCLVEYELENERYYGVMKQGERCYEIVRSTYGAWVVLADLNNNEMSVYYNNELVCTKTGKGTVDLDARGRRWEGDLRGNEPFGYGIVYDEEGQIEYNGFVINGIRSCYGKEYYVDLGIPLYEGCYSNNERYGRGRLYDRKGDVNSSGLWKENKPFSFDFDGKTINPFTKSMDLSRQSYNTRDTFLSPPWLFSLKHIVIGDDCLGKVRVFEVIALGELESIVIGEKSTTYAKTERAIRYSTRTDGSCRIANCPKLKTIYIDGYSFSDYHSFELEGLPSLQAITASESCFNQAPSFSLIGMLGWISLNNQTFLSYSQSNSVIVHSLILIRLCLRVIKRID